MNTGKQEKSLRKKISKRIRQSEIPVIVYVVIICSMMLLWFLRKYNEDIALNFLAELFGAAFTLFIVDVLLVRTKTKRWKTVREDVNYLISRTVNRLRDGISTRAFRFNPVIKPNSSETATLQSISQQRSKFMLKLATMNERELMERLNVNEIFTESSYDYFNEKADEIWAILSVKYSDYFHPELVSLLIDLHIHIKDFCSHIRHYLKAQRFPEDKEYYNAVGIKGVTITAIKIVTILNKLKQEGYSEVASFSR